MKTTPLLLSVFLCFFTSLSKSQSHAHNTDINASVSYPDVIAQYQELANKYPSAQLKEYGYADGGKPIHLFVISPEKIFNIDSLKKSGYTILLINNGIHPGEPDGIMASLRLSQDLLSGKEIRPKKVIVCIIPIYNIDGALETSLFFRSGQNGPDVVGFRGNARHLDLNRDFIKCDSENAKTFTKIYRAWDPDVFIDTHVSDGADYQYVMTLIDSQKDKLHPTVSKVMQEKVLPYLYKEMEKSGFPMTPYVNVWGESPDKGMTGFLESPRFASGYSALYNAFPLVTETHMLKPFVQRTESTYQLLKTSIRLCGAYGTEMREARKKANAMTANEQKEFALQWKLDSSYVDSLYFLGYESIIKKSDVTQRDILSFDQQKPYAKNVAYYNTFKSVLKVQKPTAYIIPQAWHEVIERLQLNQIEMQQLKRDTTLKVAVYYIKNYNTGKTAYEGHYLHNQVTLKSDTQLIQFFKGDYLIYCNQSSNRYIVETLEPQGVDAFFAWNFFDGILQQKEWFSDYLWDDVAGEILKENPTLKAEFENKRANDSTFSSSSWAMYSWIFERSKWYEPSHLRYPVYRLDRKIPDFILTPVTNKISNR